MQPVLLDFPDVFYTERLTIRSPRVGEGRKVFDATVESLDTLRLFPASLPWVLEEPSIDASETYCRNGAANFIARRDFPLLFLLRDSDTLVGCGGIHRPDWEVRAFEVGWWGRTSFARQGLMTEAISAVIAFAFASMGAHRVEAFCDDLNERSWKLCERVGMDLEGVLRHKRMGPDGTLRDLRVYSKVSPPQPIVIHR